MPTIDFNKAIQDARGASFEALPIGDYDVEVAKSEATTSSNGKPMIKVNMRVISGPYEKRAILNNFVLSLENAQATAIFFRHMKAFGLTEEWFASLGQVQSLDAVASALVGRRARLTIGHREWQGEMRNEVKAVKPYTGAPPAPGPNGAFAQVPNAGPAALPPRPPVAPQPAPVAPAPAPAPAPIAAPVAPVAPAPVPDAPALPGAQPQVQSVPQPPAPVPTSTEATAASEVAQSPSPAPVTATSEAAAPTPPPLPF